jgi:hypothetical protein
MWIGSRLHTEEYSGYTLLIKMSAPITNPASIYSIEAFIIQRLGVGMGLEFGYWLVVIRLN